MTDAHKVIGVILAAISIPIVIVALSPDSGKVEPKEIKTCKDGAEALGQMARTKGFSDTNADQQADSFLATCLKSGHD